MPRSFTGPSPQCPDGSRWRSHDRGARSPFARGPRARAAVGRASLRARLPTCPGARSTGRRRAKRARVDGPPAAGRALERDDVGPRVLAAWTLGERGRRRPLVVAPHDRERCDQRACSRHEFRACSRHEFSGRADVHRCTVGRIGYPVALATGRTAIPSERGSSPVSERAVLARLECRCGPPAATRTKTWPRPHPRRCHDGRHETQLSGVPGPRCPCSTDRQIARGPRKGSSPEHWDTARGRTAREDEPAEAMAREERGRLHAPGRIEQVATASDARGHDHSIDQKLVQVTRPIEVFHVKRGIFLNA